VQLLGIAAFALGGGLFTAAIAAARHGGGRAVAAEDAAAPR